MSAAEAYWSAARWLSTNIQTTNAKGEGFVQKGGYFEMRAKFSRGPGAWYAFWLHSVPKKDDPKSWFAEIDAVEAYAGSPGILHSTVHLWRTPRKSDDDPNGHWSSGTRVRVAGMFDGFHTYGVEVTDDWIIFYYDRKETSRVEKLPEFDVPLYMLVSLALNPGESEKAQGVMEMPLDYVKVWQKN